MGDAYHFVRDWDKFIVSSSPPFILPIGSSLDMLAMPVSHGIVCHNYRTKETN